MTRHGMILAAGKGSRLNAEEGHKLLAKIDDRPLIDYHLANFHALGVDTVVIVTGYMHRELEDQLADWSLPEGMRFEFAYNPDFELSNGVSVLAGTRRFDGPFWLVMSDHIFEPKLFARLRDEAPRFEAEIDGMLGVDYKLDTIFDSVDVGLFWCGEGFIEALEAETANRGDSNTSDAVRRLDAARRFEFWNVDDVLWQDVDTPGARAHAEKLSERWNP